MHSLIRSLVQLSPDDLFNVDKVSAPVVLHHHSSEQLSSGPLESVLGNSQHSDRMIVRDFIFFLIVSYVPFTGI